VCCPHHQGLIGPRRMESSHDIAYMNSKISMRIIIMLVSH